ncbi:MAG: FKBP-type peptidyl-prolyl cis-trans isomerase [Bacteroidaceae bacterium]|nr:FKBP-type peptidyl-prolyl cis-trans isomerase [Bacteroidaceae bacterium]
MENKFITVAYKLYTIEDGDRDFAEEATAEKPFEFISGLGLTLPVFEEKVKDLKAGETFDFVINKEDAYGIYDERQVVALPKKTFEIDGKFDSEHIVEGAIIPLMNAEGQHFNASVSSITDTEVTVDLNHPLAGCDLHFTGSIVETRPATNEELAAMAKVMSGEGGCSCGCDHCGGGCGEEGCHDEGCSGCHQH